MNIDLTNGKQRLDFMLWIFTLLRVVSGVTDVGKI